MKAMRTPRSISLFLIAFALLIAGQGPAAASDLTPGATVLWAWERPEDLRFAGPGVEVAAMTGFVVLSGNRVWARGRRFPLTVNPAARRIAMVHVQIDHRLPLVMSGELRRALTAAVLAYARPPGFFALQIDFEVRVSERPLLLNLIRDIRAALPKSVPLSITALASWCETEDWLRGAPVDEVVPMLFRMGPASADVWAELGSDDFQEPECRSAAGLSTDSPIGRLKRGRRVYLFDPKPWTPSAFADMLRRLSP
jgi:hypothetical protein